MLVSRESCPPSVGTHFYLIRLLLSAPLISQFKLDIFFIEVVFFPVMFALGLFWASGDIFQ